MGLGPPNYLSWSNNVLKKKLSNLSSSYRERIVSQIHFLW